MSGLAALLAGRRPPGVYLWRSPTPAAEVAHAAEHAGWRPFILDGRAVTTKAQLLDGLASACEFPTWFGHNWDAAADCLADLSWAAQPKRGFLLVYDGWGMLARTEPDAWIAARRVLEDSCMHWAATPTPFAVLLRGPGPDDDLTELA
jgi:hypothetical protein